jgi:hypothetical protein
MQSTTLLSHACIVAPHYSTNNVKSVPCAEGSVAGDIAAGI